MSTSEADALAVLRAVAEWAGCEQPDARSATTARWMFRAIDREYVTLDLGILVDEFADTLLGAVTRRLRADGWRVAVWADDMARAEVWTSGHAPFHMGEDPEHAILALGRAMRDAGIIRTDAQA